MTNVSMLCIDGAGNAARKQPVTLCGGVLPKINLRSPQGIPVGTPVRIRSGRQIAKGIVDCCENGELSCEVTVQIQRGGQWLLELVTGSGGYDPGVHLVNKFITDEELSQVMTELDSNSHSTRLH